MYSGAFGAFLSFLLPLVNTADPLAAQCRAGWTMVSNACQECASGKFSNTDLFSGQGCTDCAAGKTTFGKNGATVCHECPVGQFAVAGQTVCANCPSGQYGVSTGATGCGGCAAGRYGAEGVTVCTECAQVGCLTSCSTLSCSSTTSITSLTLLPSNPIQSSFYPHYNLLHLSLRVRILCRDPASAHTTVHLENLLVPPAAAGAFPAPVASTPKQVPPHASRVRRGRKPPQIRLLAPTASLGSTPRP